MPNKVGIVILNYNSSEDTIICVESILQHMKKYLFNIYIVDNRSTDQSFSILSQKYSASAIIRIIETERNGGYSYGNNIGINQALLDDCEYLAIINPDVILLNDAISRCIDQLVDNVDVGIAGPLLDEYDGQGQMARKAITFKSFFFNKSFLSKLPFSKELRNFKWNMKSNLKFDGIVAGCFMVLSSKLGQELEGFDENFFLYNEEDVLAYKLKKVQKKSMIVADARAFHAHAKTTKRSGMPFIYFHYRISEFLILQKYAQINFWEKTLIYLLNIVWFFVYSRKNHEAKKYLRLFINKYNKIYRAEYDGLNDYDSF